MSRRNAHGLWLTECLLGKILEGTSKMKILKTIWRLRDQANLVKHNPIRQATITPHILYLSLLILLTGCGATIEVPPEQLPGRTTGSHRGGGYPGGSYPDGSYPDGSYPGPVSYPDAGYPYDTGYPAPDRYQSNYPSNRHESARGSSFSLKITSTR
jgi:hypothetical protein